MERKVIFWKIVSCILLCALIIGGADRLSIQAESTGNKESEFIEEWGDMAAEDYYGLLEQKAQMEETVMERLISDYGFSTDKEADGTISMPILSKVCDLPVTGQPPKSLYVIFHYSDKNPHAYSYSGILVDYTDGSSELLFCTDAVEGAIPTTALMQIYDLKITDIDGNGEADILFLAQRLTTVTFGDNPGIYFMVGLQENGEFRFLSSRIGTDLGNIVSKLHDRQRANRRLDNILCELEEYWGGKTDGKEKRDDPEEEKWGLEEYITMKEEVMEEKRDIRSEYDAEELLWESFNVDDCSGLECLKVYKERASESICDTEWQIALYIYNYLLEELEMQAIPDFYHKLSEEYAESGGLKDVKLLELDYEDQDGDGIKDIRMLVECQMKPDGEIKKKYEVIFYQEASPENPMERFVRTSEKEIM